LNLIIEFHGEQHLIGWGRRNEDAKSIQERDLFKRNWALENGINFLEIKQWEISSKEEIESLVLAKVNQIASRAGTRIALSKRNLTDSELQIIKAKLKWTLEACISEAAKYQSIKEWQIANAGSYNAAYGKGWLDKCTVHMERKLHKRNHWTLENCIKDALQYKTRREWRLTPRSAYSTASRNKWIELCCSHMKNR
jgi:hypothetical protein